LQTLLPPTSQLIAVRIDCKLLKEYKENKHKVPMSKIQTPLKTVKRKTKCG